MNKDKAIRWLLGDDTGVSSKTMCAGILGIDLGWQADKPYDIYDLGRCVRFTEAAEVTDKDLRKICSTYPWWAEMYQRWDNLTTLYYEANRWGIYDVLHEFYVKREIKDNGEHYLISVKSTR